MPCIVTVGTKSPQIPAFLADNATLVGDIRFGAECSVWFGSILRGDINHIAVGDRSNIQDGCILHVTRDLPCELGKDVSLAHGVIAHACVVEDGCLLGMGSRVLDRAHIGAGSLVAAGCVVPEGLTVPPGHLVAGVPGRIVKALPEHLRAMCARVAGNYLAYQELYPTIQEATRRCAG